MRVGRGEAAAYLGQGLYSPDKSCKASSSISSIDQQIESEKSLYSPDKRAAASVASVSASISASAASVSAAAAVR